MEGRKYEESTIYAIFPAFGYTLPVCKMNAFIRVLNTNKQGSSDEQMNTNQYNRRPVFPFHSALNRVFQHDCITAANIICY